MSQQTYYTLVPQCSKMNGGVGVGRGGGAGGLERDYSLFRELLCHQ